MNELLRKLQLEANKYAIEKHPIDENEDQNIKDLIGVSRISSSHEKFAELIVRECANYAFSDDQERNAMLEHFGVEEPKEFSWVCEKCGADRTKEPCQLAVEGKTVYGNCPIVGVVQ